MWLCQAASAFPYWCVYRREGGVTYGVSGGIAPISLLCYQPPRTLCVPQLHGHCQRPLLLIGNRWSGHRNATRLLQALGGTRIPSESRPVYAPAFKTVEHCWSHTRDGEMADVIPQKVEHLADEVAHSLVAKHRRPDLLQAFFQHARLAL